MPGYHIGDFRTDGANRDGWFLGHFIPEPIANRTSAVEVKYWHFEAGPPKPPHPTKWLDVYECTLILKGRIRALVDGQEIELRAGQYVSIDPKTINNLALEILEPAEGITIKAPSIPGSKHEV